MFTSLSSFLYNNLDKTDPIIPYKGMLLGRGTIKGDYSPWMSMVAMRLKTGTRVGNCQSTFFSWKCTSSDCPWKVNICFSSKLNAWTVSKAELLHVNCMGRAVINAETAVTILQNHFPLETKINMPLARETLSEKYKISALSKSSLHRIVSEINSNSDESFLDGFRYLESYIDRLKVCNPDAIIQLETKRIDEKQHFEKLFIMFNCQILTLKSCKPIISLDSAFMKHPLWNHYQLIVVASSDGDNNNILLAFSLVPKENAACYVWTIQQMKRSESVRLFFDNPQLVVASDRDKGLILSIDTEFPNAHHRYCARHLLGNLPKPSIKDSKAVGTGQSILELFWTLIKTKSKDTFEQTLRLIATSRSDVVNYLERNCKREQYADAFFPGLTWDEITNNISEQSIAWLTLDNLREKSPVPFLQNVILKIIQSRQLIRESIDKLKARATDEKLIQYAYDKFLIEKESSGAYAIVHLGHNEYSVYTPTRHSSNGSNLNAHRVTVLPDFSFLMCKRNDVYCSMEQLPCRHILAVGFKYFRTKMNFNDSDSFQSLWPAFYHLATFDSSYDESYIIDPSLTDNSLGMLLPPLLDSSKKRGRPRSSRIASKQQIHTHQKGGTRTYRCIICRGRDHTKRTCSFTPFNISSNDLITCLPCSNSNPINVTSYSFPMQRLPEAKRGKNLSLETSSRSSLPSSLFSINSPSFSEDNYRTAVINSLLPPNLDQIDDIFERDTFDFELLAHHPHTQHHLTSITPSSTSPPCPSSSQLPQPTTSITPIPNSSRSPSPYPTPPHLHQPITSITPIPNSSTSPSPTSFPYKTPHHLLEPVISIENTLTLDPPSKSMCPTPSLLTNPLHPYTNLLTTSTSVTVPDLNLTSSSNYIPILNSSLITEPNRYILRRGTHVRYFNMMNSDLPIVAFVDKVFPGDPNCPIRLSSLDTLGPYSRIQICKEQSTIIPLDKSVVCSSIHARPVALQLTDYYPSLVLKNYQLDGDNWHPVNEMSIHKRLFTPTPLLPTSRSTSETIGEKRITKLRDPGFKWSDIN